MHISTKYLTDHCYLSYHCPVRNVNIEFPKKGYRLSLDMSQSPTKQVPKLIDD